MQPDPLIRRADGYPGFRKSTGPTSRDLYKDIRGAVAPPEILERVSKTHLKFSPWSPELYEECVTKQRANFVRPFRDPCPIMKC